MAYVISWPDDTFLARFAGRVTADEIEAVNHVFSGDARMESVRYSIWDFSLADIVDMPVQEIENAAAFDKGVTYVRKHLRGALIVRNTHIRAQLESYLAVANELEVKWDTRIFETIEQARNWLEDRPLPDSGR